MINKTVLLLIGFSRPQFIEDRLGEISALTDLGLQVICSIDGMETVYSKDNKDQFKVLEENYKNVTWIREKRNLGLAQHISMRVTESLQDYQSVIVIEDDVSVSKGSILSLMNILNSNHQSTYATAGLFGAIPCTNLNKVLSNSWRKTKYFSAWGWAIRREIWDLYSLNIVKNIGITTLDKCQMWNELTEKQKSRWRFRFKRVIENPNHSWDYQMQFLSFKEGLPHLLPTFRMCENLGFGDLKATNTKMPRPWWYQGKKCDSGIGSATIINKKYESLLEYVDSYTWIGDRKLNFF